MNPIYQTVMARVVAELNSRCPVCGGRLETVTSGKHSRRRCASCRADVVPRIAPGAAPRRPRSTSGAQAKAIRWPSLRRGRKR